MRVTFVALLTAVCVAVSGDRLAPAQDFGAFPTVSSASSNDEAGKLRRQERQLDENTKKIVRSYSNAEEASIRQSLEKDLRQAVKLQFDVKQQIRQRELDELEAKLKKLRERHDRRAVEADRIVADRVQQLLRDAQGLGWGTGSGGRVNVPGTNPWFYSRQPVLAEPAVVPTQPPPPVDPARR